LSFICYDSNRNCLRIQAAKMVAVHMFVHVQSRTRAALRIEQCRRLFPESPKKAALRIEQRRRIFTDPLEPLPTAVSSQSHVYYGEGFTDASTQTATMDTTSLSPCGTSLPCSGGVDAAMSIDVVKNTFIHVEEGGDVAQPYLRRAHTDTPSTRATDCKDTDGTDEDPV